MWFSQKYSLADLPVPSFSEIKGRTKIVVIDDDSNSFPFELMRKEGYSIEHWPRVESISQLENGNYDIVILDIQGVATHISGDDGLGVLELIKNNNPAQIVVAFSSHSFDLSKNRFWSLADDSLCKPVDLAKCKGLIDSLIQTRRTPDHYWRSIRQTLSSQGLSPKEITKVEHNVVKALLRKDAAGAQSVISKYVGGTDMGIRVIGIVVKIAALLGL